MSGGLSTFRYTSQIGPHGIFVGLARTHTFLPLPPGVHRSGATQAFAAGYRSVACRLSRVRQGLCKDNR